MAESGVATATIASSPLRARCARGRSPPRQRLSKLRFFTIFPELPPDIRELVWDLAIPPRCHHHTKAGLLVLYRPPAVAFVCREARAVALKQGCWIRRRRSAGEMAPGRLGSSEARPLPRIPPQVTWFNHDRDTYLAQSTAREIAGKEMPWEYGFPANHGSAEWHERHKLFSQATWFLKHFRRNVAQRIVLYHDLPGPASFHTQGMEALVKNQLADAARFPRLRYIDIVMSPCPIPGINHAWDPKLVTELFQGQPLLTVVLDDQRSVDRVLRLLKREPTGAGSWSRYDGQARALLGYLRRDLEAVVSKLRGGSWIGMKMQLDKVLVESRRETKPLGPGNIHRISYKGEEGRPEDSPESPRAPLGPLTFRPVYLFHHFDSNDDDGTGIYRAYGQVA